MFDALIDRLGIVQQLKDRFNYDLGPYPFTSSWTLSAGGSISWGCWKTTLLHWRLSNLPTGCRVPMRHAPKIWGLHVPEPNTDTFLLPQKEGFEEKKPKVGKWPNYAITPIQAKRSFWLRPGSSGRPSMSGTQDVHTTSQRSLPVVQLGQILVT